MPVARCALNLGLISVMSCKQHLFFGSGVSALQKLIIKINSLISTCDYTDLKVSSLFKRVQGFYSCGLRDPRFFWSIGEYSLGLMFRVSYLNKDLPFPPRLIACTRENIKRGNDLPLLYCEIKLTFFDFSHGPWPRVLLEHPTLQC